MLSVFTKWNKQQQKPLSKVLGDLYGIGNSRSNFLLNKFGIQNTYRLGRTSVELQKNLSHFVLNEDSQDFSPTETLLKDGVRKDIQKLQDIRSYRGVRHLLHLPVRGQRTKTNARTQKNFKPKAQLLRTSYKHKRVTGKNAASQKKMAAETSVYTKIIKKKARGRKSLQA